MDSDTVEFTTDASGDVTVHSKSVNGRLVAVYVDIGSGGTALAAGTDLTITEAETGAGLLTAANVGSASARFMPRSPLHLAADGTAISGAGGSAPVVGEIKTVVAQGGNAKRGAITFYVE